MLGRRQVERINSVLVKLGFVEIYQAKWGHFKSPSTFYVLTDKAFALDKPLVQKEHMLSKAPAPKGHVVEQPLVQKVQVTENTYKPTENTKEQKALVTATAPVTTPPISKSKTASGQMQNLKATPDKAPQPVTEWKPTGVWERTASKFHPKAAVPLTQIQGKILRDVRKKLEALGFDSDLLVSYSVQHWYSVMFDEITSSLVYEQLMAGDVKRRVSADPVDRLAPVRRP